MAMCGAASAAAVRVCAPHGGRWGWWGFHAGRTLGYAAAGAVAAASVGALEALGQWSPALRPLWTLAHMAGMALGLYLLWQGRQPQWLDRLGRDGQRQAAPENVSPIVWRRHVAGASRAAGVGGLWFAWPCGLLQSALLVASLANGAAGGAAIMATFALASALALAGVPLLWLRWAGTRPALQGRVTKMVIRLSGAALAGASAWALGHDMFVRFVAWCLS